MRCALKYGGGSKVCTDSDCAICSIGGNRTVRCCTGVLGGDGAPRTRFRLESAANVEELDSVRCRSWLVVLLNCAWLADPSKGAPDGIVATELRELVDVRRSCFDASEPVGDGCERTGETELPCILNVGETARRLVGEDAEDICAGTESTSLVVRGANGAGFAGCNKAP